MLQSEEQLQCACAEPMWVSGRKPYDASKPALEKATFVRMRACAKIGQGRVRTEKRKDTRTARDGIGVRTEGN